MDCNPENFAFLRCSCTRSSLHAHNSLEAVVPEFLTRPKETADVA